MKKIISIFLFVFVLIDYTYSQTNESDSRRLRYPDHPPNCCHNTVGKSIGSGGVNSNADLQFGINADAGGIFPLGYYLPSIVPSAAASAPSNFSDFSYPSINFNFIKNNLYSIVNLTLPYGILTENPIVVFGISGIVNYLWNTDIDPYSPI